MDSKSFEKFRSCFGDMSVYKDLKNSNFFSTLGLPSFMRDWLLQRYQDDDGRYEAGEISAFVNKYMPRQNEWLAIKDRIVTDYENVKILAKILVDINISTSEISFSLPDYGISNNQTMIDNGVWNRCKEELVSGKETWGLIELGYRPPDDSARPKIPGRIKLLSFQNFCPYEIDLDYFKDARAEFTIDEWRDIILGAVDYNPAGYDIARKKDSELPDVGRMKMAFISRLAPFVEKRLNLMELAPKGIGKSYVFGQLSRHGWLSTSDRITRAKLFYDMNKRCLGLVGQNDFVVLDEIQKTCFDEGMGAILQGYLEQGVFTVGNYQGASDCGMVLCGNIEPELMNADGRLFMFGKLPALFHDPAIIDRFHGFIKGWHIPRMNDDLKVNGWALNSEYFTAIMHELRSDASYRYIVDEIVQVPEGADTRDTEAIKRVATALLKLLFPNTKSAGDIKPLAFEHYCLRPARNMRAVIRRQLHMMDEQYKLGLPDLIARKEP